MSNKDLGNLGEDLASEYLINKGAEIIARNFRTKDAEIDIVFFDRDEKTKLVYLVFCEVKFRNNDNCGLPLEAVDYKKQRKIAKASSYFIYKNRIDSTFPVRYDVISIINGRIEHIKNAFEFMY